MKSFSVDADFLETLDLLKHEGMIEMSVTTPKCLTEVLFVSVAVY